MSTPILIMALARTLGRSPTDEERKNYLNALAELAGGRDLYIPKRQRTGQEATIIDLKGRGLSLRVIAKQVGCTKAYVVKILSANPVISRTHNA